MNLIENYILSFIFTVTIISIVINIMFWLVDKEKPKTLVAISWTGFVFSLSIFVLSMYN